MIERNTPYVKQYNEQGDLINPIKGAYLSPYLNRRQRAVKKERFMNNSRSVKLVVLKNMKYRKFIQLERDVKTGQLKRIEHYVKC
jgi:hypothetical protein